MLYPMFYRLWTSDALRSICYQGYRQRSGHMQERVSTPLFGSSGTKNSWHDRHSCLQALQTPCVWISALRRFCLYQAVWHNQRIIHIMEITKLKPAYLSHTKRQPHCKQARQFDISTANHVHHLLCCRQFFQLRLHGPGHLAYEKYGDTHWLILHTKQAPRDSLGARFVILFHFFESFNNTPSSLYVQHRYDSLC